MAIIYTYDTTFPESDDLLLGTERNATLRQPTKNFKVADLAKFIINTFNGTDLTIPLFFDITDPTTGRVDTELRDSILSQNAYPNGNTLTVAGNLVVTGAFTDSTGKTGTNGQSLTSTVTGTEWKTIASDKTFVFNQAIPSATWTINHTLDKFPSITVVSTANQVVIGDAAYTSTTQVVITFTAGFAGKAYLN
jgi:hypothetical protein|tara:strand:+ start:989 stop:1567 length:579 start_codon:yes stop_codon:yes gene_type:complete